LAPDPPIVLGRMNRRLDLPRPRRVEHAEVQRRWKWFRELLERHYGLGGLPESFGADEGELSVIKRVDEDDSRFDLVAPEYNYNSRSQTLRFQQGPHAVEVLVSLSDVGDFFHFDYGERGQPLAQVHYFAAQHACYLDLDDSTQRFSDWEAAVAGHPRAD
jgi:hypothetical protein